MSLLDTYLRVSRSRPCPVCDHADWCLISRDAPPSRAVCARVESRQGKRPCGAVPFGFMNPPPGSPGRGTLQIVPEKAAVVRRIFEMSAQGMSDHAIAKTLNAQGVPSPKGLKWTATVLLRLRRCPAYVGVLASFTWVYDRKTKKTRYDPDNPRAIVVEGTHEAIVPRELWDAVHGRARLVRTCTPNLLSGLLWVNGLRTRGGSDGTEACYAPPKGSRGQAWLKVEPTDEAVWSAFASLATGPEFVQRLIAEASSPRDRAIVGQEIEHLEGQLGRHRRRISNLVDMRADGEISREEYDKKRAESEEALASAEAELRTLRARSLAMDGSVASRVAKAVQVLVAGQRLLTRKQKRAVLTSIVRRVDVRAEDTGAAYQRDAKGHVLPVKLNRWAIRSVEFVLALPPDGDHAGAAGGTPAPVAPGAVDATCAIVGATAGNAAGASGSAGEGSGGEPGHLERGPLTPSQVNGSGEGGAAQLERRFCTPSLPGRTGTPAGTGSATRRGTSSSSWSTRTTGRSTCGGTGSRTATSRGRGSSASRSRRWRCRRGAWWWSSTGSTPGGRGRWGTPRRRRRRATAASPGR